MADLAQFKVREVAFCAQPVPKDDEFTNQLGGAIREEVLVRLTAGERHAYDERVLLGQVLHKE